jgi:ABC-type Na+ efflux pump permease subunit
MNNITLIIRKEWMSFAGSGRSMFVLYAVLVAYWVVLLATWQDPSLSILSQSAANRGTTVSYMPLWFALFSLIVTSIFANTVFVAERVTGSLEILLTSGVSRNGILFGKMLFVTGMTMVIGAVCIGLSLLIKQVVYHGPMEDISLIGFGYALYTAAAFLNAAASAWLSVVLPNPRIVPLLNLLLISVITGVQMAATFYLSVPPWAAAGAMVVLGCLFCALSRLEYDSERIIKPVIL